MSNEIKRMQELAGINNDKLTPEQEDAVIYTLFGEGPTFTNSQMGGHPFFDWDIESNINRGIHTSGNESYEMKVEGDDLILTTKFNIDDYIRDNDDTESYFPGIKGDSMVDLFNRWWKENEVDGKVEIESGDLPWSTTLYMDGNRGTIVDRGNYEEILEDNG